MKRQDDTHRLTEILVSLMLAVGIVLAVNVLLRMAKSEPPEPTTQRSPSVSFVESGKRYRYEWVKPHRLVTRGGLITWTPDGDWQRVRREIVEPKMHIVYVWVADRSRWESRYVPNPKSGQPYGVSQLGRMTR